MTITAPVQKVRYGITALIASNVFLAFGPWFVRMADTGPVSAAFWRVALAAPLLFVIAYLAKDPARKSHMGFFWLFAFSALFFAADLSSWHNGIEKTKMANSNLLGNSTSLFLPITAMVIGRKLPARIQSFALFLALIGAALMMGRSFSVSADSALGDFLCLLAGALYTGYLLIMARTRSQIGPWPTLAWSTLFCIAPLGLASLYLNEKIWPGDWTPLLALALSSQILGQCLMIYVINALSPLIIGISLLTQPIIGAILGWYAYGETLSPIEWAGAALIAIALILVRQDSAKDT